MAESNPNFSKMEATKPVVFKTRLRHSAEDRGDTYDTYPSLPPLPIPSRRTLLVEGAGRAAIEFGELRRENKTLTFLLKNANSLLENAVNHGHPPARPNSPDDHLITFDPPTNDSNSTPSSLKQAPDIMWTIYRDTGNPLKDARTYQSVSEKDYDNIRDTASGAAIEMKKHIRVIEPPKNISGRDPRGNPVLNGDIVDLVESERMIIRSQRLLNELRKVIYWPTGAYYDGQKKLALDTPYRSIGVYRRELAKLRNEHYSHIQGLQDLDEQDPAKHKITDMKQTVQELDLVLKEVDKVQSANVALEEERHLREPQAVATFDMLWMLFKPGDYVYVNINGFEVAARANLLFWQGSRSIEDPYLTVTFRVWYLDHDGRFINRRGHSLNIDRFRGERIITELPVYPAKFAKDYKEKHERRVSRGRRYLNLIKGGFSHCSYDGMLSVGESDPYESQHHTYASLQKFQGKVIADPEQHWREKGPGTRMLWADQLDTNLGTVGDEMRKFIDLDPQKANDESIFGDDHCYLLPEWIRGFTVGTRGVRDWAWLNIDNLQIHKGDASLIKTVSLPERSLNRIKALVFQSEKAKERGLPTDHIFRPEYISQKGEGRLILLHGSPGYGKTYTVECIAEWSDRPLMRLTCAELGLDATKLETNLYRYLKRAERWKAIVLIDEADIFLEMRTRGQSIEREAIVAVFLRTLEYYSGIMFLTTNRVRGFDPAVINRMALVVHYDALDTVQRAKIRGNCLRRLDKDEHLGITESAKIAAAKLDDDKYEWSGREINSVFKLAGMFTQYERANSNPNFDVDPGPLEIDDKHIDEAIAVIKELEQYYERYEKKPKGDRLEYAEMR